MLSTTNRPIGCFPRSPESRGKRFSAAALLALIIATAAVRRPVPVLASVVSSPGPLIGRMQGYTPRVKVRCADGLSLTRVLAVPGIKHDGHPLLGGIVWVGHRHILAFTYSRLLQWSFSGRKTVCTSAALGPNVASQRLGLFAFHKKAVLVSARASGASHKSALVLSAVLPGSLAIRQWIKLPGEACGIRRGPGGRVDFPRVILPAAGGWIGAMPHHAVPGDRFVIRRLDRTAVTAKMPLLFEPRNIGFAAADGDSCGWVSQGHWVRVLAMKRGPGRVARIHVIGPDIQYGALSPHGGQLALIAYGPSTLLGSQTLLLLLNTNNPSQEKLFSLSRGYTRSEAPACPPVFSSDGRLVAASTLRRTSHLTDEILIIDAGQPKVYCKARFGFDAPICLAFSPGGRHLAVECWYRIFVFKLPKGFPLDRSVVPGGIGHRRLFRRVEAVTLPAK